MIGVNNTYISIKNRLKGRLSALMFTALNKGQKFSSPEAASEKWPCSAHIRVDESVKVKNFIA